MSAEEGPICSYLKAPQGPLRPDLSLNRESQECVEVRVDDRSYKYPSLLAQDWGGQRERELADCFRSNHAAQDDLSCLPYAQSLELESSMQWDAAWDALSRLVVPVTTVAAEQAVAGDHQSRIRLPFLRRFSFLLLSAPYREAAGEPGGGLGVHGLSRYLQGRSDATQRWYRLNVWQARNQWTEVLLEHEDHVGLVTRGDECWIDEQARLVVWRDARKAGLLKLSDASTAGEPRSETAFTRRFLREFFLRRLMLGDTWRLVGQLDPSLTDRGLLVLPIVLLVAFGVLGLLLAFPVGLPVWLSPPSPLMLGAAAATLYGAILAGVLWRGSEAAYPFCLRLAGGAALGAAALVSIGGTWWQAGGDPLRLAVAGPVLAAIGYLAIEARSHGARGFAAIGRAMLVAALGWSHAVAVSSGLLVTTGEVLISGFDPERYLGSAIPISAAAGLALGIFLQLLWEDRPVTYPLTHMAWRRGS